jgi:ribosomal subunit interface protein
MIRHGIKGTGLQVTRELQQYAEKKFEHAEKFIRDDSSAYVDIELEHSPLRDGDKYRAEFTLSASGAVYRAEAWGSTMHAALDLASGALVKELRRSKSKHLRLVRRGGAALKDLMRGLRGRF